LGALIHDEKIAITAERYGVRSLKPFDASSIDEEGARKGDGAKLKACFCISLTRKRVRMGIRSIDVRGHGLLQDICSMD